MRAFLIALLLSAHAYADLQVDRKLTASDGRSKEVVVLRETYGPSQQRVDILDAGGKKVTARLSIFDAERKEMFLLDEKDKKYLVTSRRQFDALAKTSGRKVAVAEIPATFTRLGNRAVGSWKCTVYGVRRGGEKLGEVCVVPLSELSLTVADLGIFGRIGELNWDANTPADRTDWMYETRHGFPVEIVAERTKAMRPSRVEVLAVRKVATDSDRYKLPAGYARAEMPGLPGQILMPAPKTARRGP